MGIHKTHHLLKVVWVVVLVIMNWENPKVFINASGAISSILHFDFFFSMMMWKIEARHTNWSFFYELTISVFFVFSMQCFHISLTLQLQLLETKCDDAAVKTQMTFKSSRWNSDYFEIHLMPHKPLPLHWLHLPLCLSAVKLPVHIS